MKCKSRCTWKTGAVLRSDLAAGCSVEGVERTQLDKWPPAPLFAVASSTHFEKVREPGGGNITLPSRFVPNKVYSFMQQIKSTLHELIMAQDLLKVSLLMQ